MYAICLSQNSAWMVKKILTEIYHPFKLNRIKLLERKKADSYPATDEDREGEAITWHLAQTLGLTNDQPCDHEKKRSG